MIPAYDIFILYSMKDVFFVRNLVKSLQRLNISVKYEQETCHNIEDALQKGFENALLGILIISHGYIQEFGCSINEIKKFITTENQMLHPIWLELSKSDVINIEPCLVGTDNWGLESPPETTDSIAQLMSLKLAGSLDLQRKVLLGKQIQYESPQIGTIRRNVLPAFQQSKTEYLIKTNSYQLGELAEIHQSDVTFNEESTTEKGNCMKIQNTKKDELLSMLSNELHEAISQRFDVYLKNLANWKDLAMYFSVADTNNYFQHLYQTGKPTLNLLNELCVRNISVKQLKDACTTLRRHDVIAEIERFEHNETLADVRYKRE